MKDEIKEILEFDFQSQGERIEINEYERDILKDYITNLQEERNMFKGSFETMSKNYFEEKLKNEKAIEKIKKIQENAIKYGADHDAIICQDLLNILQGEDKDAKD